MSEFYIFSPHIFFASGRKIIHSTQRIVMAAALSIFSLLLVSCSFSLPKPSPPVTVYTISPVIHETLPEVKKCSAVLKLARMISPRSYDQTGIMYTDQEFGLNSYSLSRWIDTPAAMLEVLFARAVEETGAFRSVVPVQSRAGFDLLLESRLLDFSLHLEREGPIYGVVSVEFFLIDSSSGRLLADRVITVSERSESPDAADAVKALNAASLKASYELSVWLSDRCP